MAAELAVGFAGRRGRLFGLALRTAALTVLTLGFYRFWMKTRLRRYYWSSVRPGGHPLEYVGEPLEKLLGFLTAVVVMAFYIGVVNLVLMFGSYAIFNGNVWAYALSFIGVIPIIFFAQYRARRYVLARTRWRGIRFGVEPGAWGYAGRALLWWMLGFLSLGILFPRGGYALEKYRTDRTFFGQERFRQGGSPWMLMASSRHVWIGLILTGLGIGGAAGLSASSPVAGFVMLAVAGGGWTAFGLVFYKVDCFRRLSATKELAGARLHSAARPWRIARHYALGYVLVSMILFALGVAAVFLLVALIGLDRTDRLIDLGQVEDVPGWAVAAIGALAYFSVFILWGVLNQVLIGLPNMRHFAETLTVTGAQDLGRITQRARDEFAEAEGFADALDVGAAI